jgi:hypothetical protein
MQNLTQPKLKPPKAQWLLYVPPGLAFTNSTFCPHSVFMCFVWISEQTAIISLHSINWLVFITETECVYCAVRAKYLNTVQVCCVFQAWGSKCLASRHWSTSLTSNQFICDLWWEAVTLRGAFIRALQFVPADFIPSVLHTQPWGAKLAEGRVPLKRTKLSKVSVGIGQKRTLALRLSLFWGVTQLWLVVDNWRFGTKYKSDFQGSCSLLVMFDTWKCNNMLSRNVANKLPTYNKYHPRKEEISYVRRRRHGVSQNLNLF